MRKLTEDYLQGVIVATEIESTSSYSIDESVKPVWSFEKFENGMKVTCCFTTGFEEVETSTDRGILIESKDIVDSDYFRILASESEEKFIAYVQDILEKLSNLF